MATPEMLIQGFSTNLRSNNPGHLRILTKNPDGTPLDVSSGYTVGSIEFAPVSQPNLLANPGSLTSSFNFAFDTTGVSITWTAVQANALLFVLPSLAETCYLYLSNDGNTTKSIAAIGIFNIDPLAYALS